MLVYAWQWLTGLTATLRVVKLCITEVYGGLAFVPLLLYHVLFGPPLAGLSRLGVEAWISQNAADAYWLLFVGHRMVDILPVLCFIAVMGLLWGTGERVVRHWGVQTLLWFLMLATSLTVALSLAIHSTLVHIR